MELSLLNLLIILLLAWVAGIIANRIGYPAVLGELLAGIIFGPPLLGLVEGSEALNVLAEVGIIMMMLYIGMEIDPRELQKASKGGFLAAIGGFITPFALCYYAIIYFGGTPMAATFVGVAAGVTSLATKSRILVDLKLLDTRIAHVMMAGALIADTLSLIIFAALLGVAEAGSISMQNIVWVVLKTMLFFGGATLMGLYVLPYLGKKLQAWNVLGSMPSFMMLMLVTLIFAELAEMAGMHSILGAFVAGLFLRDRVFGRAVSQRITTYVHHASIGFLAPIFFVTAGFTVTLDVIFNEWQLLVLIVFLATIGKIVGTMFFYLPTGHGWREGLTIGSGMNGRGAVEIIIAQIGLTMGLITQEIFSILVFMAIFTTATVPVLLKITTDWLKRRGELVRSEGNRDRIIIIGADMLARTLAKVLHASNPVVLIDNNVEHIELAKASGLSAFVGNALQETVLETAGASYAKHVIAITPNPQVNALAGKLAVTTFSVPQVHLLDKTTKEELESLLEHIGATIMFGGQTVSDFWNFHLRGGHAQIQEEMITLPLDLHQFKKMSMEILPLAIKRNNKYYPFHSGIEIKQNDMLVSLRMLPEVETK